LYARDKRSGNRSDVAFSCRPFHSSHYRPNLNERLTLFWHLVWGLPWFFSVVRKIPGDSYKKGHCQLSPPSSRSLSNKIIHPPPQSQWPSAEVITISRVQSLTFKRDISSYGVIARQEIFTPTAYSLELWFSFHTEQRSFLCWIFGCSVVSLLKVTLPGAGMKEITE